MSFSILLSLTAQLISVSTECAAALLSFRYPRSKLVTVSLKYKYVFYLKRLQLTQFSPASHEDNWAEQEQKCRSYLFRTTVCFYLTLKTLHLTDFTFKSFMHMLCLSKRESFCLEMFPKKEAAQDKEVKEQETSTKAFSESVRN